MEEVIDAVKCGSQAPKEEVLLMIAPQYALRPAEF